MASLAMERPNDAAPAAAATPGVTGFGTNETAAIPTEKTAKPLLVASNTFLAYESSDPTLLWTPFLIAASNDVPILNNPTIRLRLLFDPKELNYSIECWENDSSIVTHQWWHLHSLQLYTFQGKL